MCATGSTGRPARCVTTPSLLSNAGAAAIVIAAAAAAARLHCVLQLWLQFWLLLPLIFWQNNTEVGLELLYLPVGSRPVLSASVLQRSDHSAMQ